MALCQAAKESVWMTDFLKNLSVSVCESVVMNADNQGSIAIAKNSTADQNTFVRFLPGGN
jgi:hypothetical protein